MRVSAVLAAAALVAGALLLPAGPAAAGDVLNHDLTGDGTADSVSYTVDTTDPDNPTCTLTITPGDVSGVWAGRAFSFAVTEPGFGPCPHDAVEGHVRGDGSWQLYDDGSDAGLETFVRGTDTIVAESAQGVGPAGSIEFFDEDGDGRDDVVSSDAGKPFGFDYNVSPDGHFDGTYQPQSTITPELSLRHPHQVYGQANQLQVVLIGDNPSDPFDPVPPDGPVIVSVDGRQVAAVVPTVPDSGPISFAVNLPVEAVGSHQIEVANPGDRYIKAFSASITLTVTKAATVSRVSVSGRTLKLLVVTKAPGSGTPTGAVAALIDGHSVVTGKLRNGSLLLSTSLKPGRHTVAVGYAGDHNHSPSFAVTTVSSH